VRSSPSDTPFKDDALMALVLCPDDKPDAFVLRRVEDEDDPEGGMLTFSLVCMDDRGDLVNVGLPAPRARARGVLPGCRHHRLRHLRRRPGAPARNRRDRQVAEARAQL